MKISRRLEPHHTFRELRAFMTEEWQNLPMNVINKCVRSMNKRAMPNVSFFVFVMSQYHPLYFIKVHLGLRRSLIQAQTPYMGTQSVQ